MLGLSKPLEYSASSRMLTILTPRFAPGEAPCQHAFAFKITGAELLPESLQP
jgi:hypothetical protein